ncbi:hypothetical protein [Parvularcula sp. LCG005]|uniref:hypothetical protein n=1 Tax=Parvularcula sp. LCG005 TaxID=3078805 RepID=UPI00294372D3|nr:hypothetical protein [Parvularcula sp. LCG005]WOI53939.1 hypothetical protein RUI03_02790 [Parvularcula sp. LCG005]
MRFSVVLSLLLHAGVIAAFFMGWLPARKPPVYTPPIPIEVISKAELGELISIPETRKDEPAAETPPVTQPDPQPEPPQTTEPEPQPEPVVEPKPEPVVDPVPDPTPEPPKEEPKPDPPKPDPPKPDPPKKEPPKQEPPKPAEDELDLGDLSDSLRNLDPDDKDRRKPQEISPEAAVGDFDSEQIGEGRQLTITEEAAFNRAMQRCWSTDLGAKDPESLVVRLRFTFTITGELAKPVEVLNDGEINRSGNQYWRAARLRAVQAAEACAPYEFLDPGRYREWQVVILNFRPTLN